MDTEDLRNEITALHATEQNLRAAIEAHEARKVPNGWQLVRTDVLKMAVDFAVTAMKRDRDSPSNSAWMVEAADRNINAVLSMLASAPPAPQASVVFCTYPKCHSTGKTCTGPCATQPIQKASVVQEPVARLMVWQGPAHQPVPFGGVCARTFSEFPKASADDPKSYWKNGKNLYTYPAPVREPLTEAKIDEGIAKLAPQGTRYWRTEVLAFRDGVRFAEAAHGITKEQP